MVKKRYIHGYNIYDKIASTLVLISRGNVV